MAKQLKLVVSFLLVYAALYCLSILGSGAGLSKWLTGPVDFYRLDYSLWLLPIAGFFLVYMGLDWLTKEAGFGKAFGYIFPVLLLIASYAAFYAAVFYYMMNQYYFGGVSFSDFLDKYNSGINYWGLFLSSSFIYFALAGLGAWAARMLIERTETQEKAP
ncbi:Uncharacterised protein [uncultured archaeon]|nr:Uncharacterised protein [uncultured archaeon]